MNGANPKRRLIPVLIAELKELDAEVVRTMDVCPSCGTVDKNDVSWHLMCHRCYAALPPGVRKCVDREPAAILFAQFMIYMKALGRTHAFLTRRGEELKEEERLRDEALERSRGPAAPIEFKPPPRPARRSPVSRGRIDDERVWETIWNEK